MDTQLLKTPMRLFKGNNRLDAAGITRLFMGQLSNIYCTKSHLVKFLPEMAEKASFPDLQRAILDCVDSIKMELLRMDVIFKMFGETYHEQKCMGIKSITLEAYLASNAKKQDAMERDMGMLIHLRIIESIEITCFEIVNDIARAMPNHEVNTLLQENIRSAISTERMFKMITAEYIG